MQRRHTRAWLAVLGASFLAVSFSATGAFAQDSKSAPLVKELTDILSQRKLDTVAAKNPAAPDQFVAALFFPGQLLVISARTTAPAVVNEKLVRREFRDVYMDLNSASIPESRVMITDGGADGLRPRREANQPFDMQDAAGKTMRFNGNWREQKVSEQDYMKTFSSADDTYVTALQALLAELKKAS